MPIRSRQPGRAHRFAHFPARLARVIEIELGPFGWHDRIMVEGQRFWERGVETSTTGAAHDNDASWRGVKPRARATEAPAMRGLARGLVLAL
eukprot:428356-Prorocentrum_lima.AAC.1